MTDKISAALIGGPCDGRLMELDAHAINLPLHVVTALRVSAIPPADFDGGPTMPAIQTTYRFTGSIDDHGIRQFTCLR